MDDKILFSEKQKFRQAWLWIILLFINGFFFFAMTRQIFLGHQFGSKPMTNGGLVATTSLTFLFSLLLLNIRLETNIKGDGIYVRFFPFQLSFKYYSWHRLNQCFVRQYDPIREYGGWGLRGLGKDRAFSVSGNTGIQLLLKDKSKLLIGTNKAAEVTKILQQLGHWVT